MLNYCEFECAHGARLVLHLTNSRGFGIPWFLAVVFLSVDTFLYCGILLKFMLIYMSVGASKSPTLASTSQPQINPKFT